MNSFFKEYELKIGNLSVNEKKLRDIYLRNLSLGQLEGPLTGYASIDKPWLKYYSVYSLMDDYKKESVYNCIKNVSVKYPKNVAISYFGRKITYSDLINKIDTVSNSFIDIGVKEGDVVTLAVPNIPENIISFYALNKIGAIANFVDLTSKGEELKNYINEVDTKILLFSDLFLDNLRNVIDDTVVQKVIMVSVSESFPFVLKKLYGLKERKKIVDDLRFVSWDNFVDRASNVNFDVNDMYKENRAACIVHTSGTTGVPKGVMLTDDNFNAMSYQYENSGLEFSRGDNFFNQVPPFLAYNIVMASHLPLSLGMNVIMYPDYKPEKYAENILKYRAKHSIAGPADWANFIDNKILKNKDLSFMSTMASGSDKMNSLEKEKVNSILEDGGCSFKIIEGYGMSEGSTALTTNLPQCNILDSVGIPLVKTSICIYDNENECELGYLEKGEICACGPTVMKEYYNNPDATNSILKRHSDGKMWLHTGDLGYMTLDGVLYLDGRLKRLITRYDGQKISPFEVESVIRKLDFVDDCCVVGIYDLEHQKGSVAVANIILSNDCLLTKEEALDNIRLQCKEELREIHLPKEYTIVDSFPLTKVGKVDYRKLENDNSTRLVKTLKK